MTRENKNTGASEVPEPHSLTDKVNHPLAFNDQFLSYFLSLYQSKRPTLSGGVPLSKVTLWLAKIATVFVGRRTIPLPLVKIHPRRAMSLTLALGCFQIGQDGSTVFHDFTDREAGYWRGDSQKT